MSVTLKDASGQWWNPGAQLFNSPTAIYSAASGVSPGVTSAGWNWTFDSTKLTTNHSYEAHAFGTDQAGNIESDQFITFAWDITPPVSTVTIPMDGVFLTANALTQITGSAYDYNSINQVQISIREDNVPETATPGTEDRWWNGATWVGPQVTPVYISVAANLTGQPDQHIHVEHELAGTVGPDAEPALQRRLAGAG